jgi:hypothetical protein
MELTGMPGLNSQAFLFYLQAFLPFLNSGISAIDPLSWQLDTIMKAAN